MALAGSSRFGTHSRSHHTQRVPLNSHSDQARPDKGMKTVTNKLGHHTQTESPTQLTFYICNPQWAHGGLLLVVVVLWLLLRLVVVATMTSGCGRTPTLRSC